MSELGSNIWLYESLIFLEVLAGEVLLFMVFEEENSLACRSAVG